MDIDLLPNREISRKVFRIPVVLHPKQIEIDRNPARFKIVRAGRKFGKTTFAQKKALDWLAKPDSVVWFIAPFLKQAKQISWSEFKRMVPPDALGKKPNDVELTITLKNGSQLILMGSDDPDSLRGPAPSGVIFDEAAYHRREAWQEVVAPNLIPKKAPALFITTPKGFNWFKDLEDSALRMIGQGSKDWAVFHFTVWDNPHLDKSEIERAKKECDSDQVWRQEYLAEYESSVGRVFSAFDGELGGRHVQRVVMPVGSFDAYRGIDWGMRDNTAALWAFIKNRSLYIYREHLANNLSAPAQAEIIKNQTSRYENVLKTAISHDAAKEDPAMKGLTVLWHFRQAGISPLRPSSRDKKHSRAMIQQLLHENRLVIDIGCPKLRKQLLAYEWKDTTMEQPDQNAEDDGVDSLHYLVEMLQFDLFLGRPREEMLTEKQIYAEIARERIDSWRNPRTTVPSIFSEGGSEFGSQCENTAAGYI